MSDCFYMSWLSFCSDCTCCSSPVANTSLPEMILMPCSSGGVSQLLSFLYFQDLFSVSVSSLTHSALQTVSCCPVGFHNERGGWHLLLSQGRNTNTAAQISLFLHKRLLDSIIYCFNNVSRPSEMRAKCCWLIQLPISKW